MLAPLPDSEHGPSGPQHGSVTEGSTNNLSDMADWDGTTQNTTRERDGGKSEKDHELGRSTSRRSAHSARSGRSGHGHGHAMREEDGDEDEIMRDRYQQLNAAITPNGPTLIENVGPLPLRELHKLEKIASGRSGRSGRSAGIDRTLSRASAVAGRQGKDAEAALEEDEEVSEHDEGDGIPNGGYGWVVVVCCVVGNAMTWGLNTNFGVFTSYYLAHNTFSGGQMGLAWVGGLSAASATTAGPLGNYLVGRFGFKVPMYMGAVLVGLGQCLAGVTEIYGVFIVTQGLIFGWGVGLILVPMTPLLAHWFSYRLSLAQGIAACGSGVGGLIFSNITPIILERIGVRYTLITYGLISWFCLTVITTLVKGRHAALHARSAPLELKWFVHKGFRWLLLWAFLSISSYYIGIYSMASFATNGLGMTQKQGGAIQSILSAGQIFGRPFWGWALDRGGRANMIMVAYVIVGVFTIGLWYTSTNMAMLGVYAFINGACGGTVHSGSGPLTASVVGVRDLGSALVIYWLTTGIPSLVGQVIAIALVDYSRDSLHRTGPHVYQISIGYSGGLFIAAAAALYPVKAYLQGNWRLMGKA